MLNGHCLVIDYAADTGVAYYLQVGGVGDWTEGSSCRCTVPRSFGQLQICLFKGPRVVGPSLLDLPR